MFYELDTFDPSGNTPWKRSSDAVMNGTFEGEVAVLAQITGVADPDAQLAQQDLVNNATAAAAILGSILTDGEVEHKAFQEVPNILPDGYGRVFHPQILLHQLIANLILYEIENDYSVREGYPSIPETLAVDSCQTPSVTTTSTLSPTTSQYGLGTVDCYPEDPRPVPHYGVVDPDGLSENVQHACGLFAKQGDYDKDPAGTDPGDTGVVISLSQDVKLGPDLWFAIRWINSSDCAVPGDASGSQNMDKPLGEFGPDCADIFYNDIFQACQLSNPLQSSADELSNEITGNNTSAGRGGQIVAGCLVYDFKACYLDLYGDTDTICALV